MLFSDHRGIPISCIDIHARVTFKAMSKERLNEEEAWLETSTDPIHSILLDILKMTQPLKMQISFPVIPTDRNH